VNSHIDSWYYPFCLASFNPKTIYAIGNLHTSLIIIYIYLALTSFTVLQQQSSDSVQKHDNYNLKTIRLIKSADRANVTRYTTHHVFFF